MIPAMQNNIGAYLEGVNAVTPFDGIVAAGAGDNTERDGVWVDRDRSGKLPQSCKLVIFGQATLAEGETLTIAANLQDATSSGGAGAADFGTALAATVVATGPAGGGTVDYAIAMDVDLRAARQFIRAQVTPDLSAAGVDTASIAACLVLGGFDQLPA